MPSQKIIRLLNERTERYNSPAFIASDPVSIPHLFSKQQDIEIAGFFAAIFSWGNRTTIIQKSKELIQLMDSAPHEFVLQHSPKDLQRLFSFKHRTFTTTDLLYFIELLKHHYTNHESLEPAFISPLHSSTSSPIDEEPMRTALVHFHNYFFSLEDVPSRTKKHIATPARNSSCKRLNMFLRWMVRKDNNGVDFGIWKNISPAHLICPLDLHVVRVAKSLGLLNRKQTDWQAAVELTEQLRRLDPMDPVKYDFALFGMGIVEKY